MRVSFGEEEEVRSFRHAAGGTDSEAGKGTVTNSGTRNLEAETIRSKTWKEYGRLGACTDQGKTSNALDTPIYSRAFVLHRSLCGVGSRRAETETEE